MKYLYNIIYLVLLAGCAKEQKPFQAVFTAAFIQKESIVAYVDQMEASTFEFNGEVHMMISDREHDEILIYKGQNLIHTENTHLNFAAAYVENGTLYVFGTYQNKVLVIESTDLLSFTAPRTVMTVLDQRELYNVSIDKTPTGYVMSYEIHYNGHFNIRFAASPDLYSWVEAGAHFSPNAYAACPTIRFIDGVYYMMYLKDFGHWATVVARSTDLINWETSSIVALSALNTEGETVNNSDVDILEVNGQVLINYVIGNQNGDAGIKFAHYNGTLKQFFNEFFN